MQIVKITLMSSVLILSLGLGGCSDSDTTSTPVPGTNPDKNTTKPGNNDDNTTGSISSAGIYMAESKETDKNGYEFYTHPVYIGSTLYAREYRFSYSTTIAMKVVGYDLSRFTADSNLSDLLSETVYEQEGPNYTHARFNQRYYDIAEVGGALYFSTLPKDINTSSQSSYIKYDIASRSQIYHQQGTPLKGKYLNTTFDLARGWFIPFSNDQYMGVVEDAVVKVFNVSDGSYYKYGTSSQYDYFGRGDGGGSYTNGLPPVGDNDHFYFADSKFYNVSYLSNVVDYGDRDYNNDPEYKVRDILEDVKANYSGSKEYTLANYNGDASGAISPLVVEGDTIYLIASMAYDNSEGYRLHDLYLLEYDKTSTLQEMYLLGEQHKIGASFDATHVYKYGDNLYFKFRSDSKSEFCSYDLTTHAYNYKKVIGNHTNSSYQDHVWITYAITGDTVIIPEKVKPADYDVDDSETTYYYDLVFTVLNLNDGTVVKTLKHKEFMKLGSNDGVYLKGIYSDANSVYFTGTKWTRTTQHNVIVKIDSNNSVHFSRFRFDAHHTGVIIDD